MDNKDMDDKMKNIMSHDQNEASNQVDSDNPLKNLGGSDLDNIAKQAMDDHLGKSVKKPSSSQPKSSSSADPQEQIADSTNAREEKRSASSSVTSSTDSKDDSTANDSSESSSQSSIDGNEFASESANADSQLSEAYGNDYNASDYSPFGALRSASTAIDEYKKAGRKDDNISPEQAHDMDMFCKNAVQAISSIHSGMNYDYLKLSEMAKALESQEKVISDSKHSGQFGALMADMNDGAFEKITQFMHDMIEMYESPEFQTELSQIRADKRAGKKVDLKYVDPAHVQTPVYRHADKHMDSMASEYDESKSKASGILSSLSAKGLTGGNNIFTANPVSSSASSNASEPSDNSMDSTDDKNKEDN